MNSKLILAAGIIALMLVASAVLGCTGPATNNNNPSPSTTTPSTTPGGVSDKITVTHEGNKIIISGGKVDESDKQKSEPFKLDVNKWYIVKITYSGPAISNFIADVTTQKMIDDDMTIAGLLPMFLGPDTVTTIKTKGTYKTDDYMIYVESSGGPWTIEITESPVPTASGSKAFSGEDGTSVTPFFHLDAGSTTFTITQNLKGQFSVPIEVELVNADTGDLVTYLVHNEREATQTVTKDIDVAGNYIMRVSCGGTWTISY